MEDNIMALDNFPLPPLPQKRYSVRQPISSDPRLDGEGIVLARANTKLYCEVWIDKEWAEFKASEHYTPGAYLQRYVWDEHLQQRVILDY